MVYKDAPPELIDLYRIAQSVENYPASAEEIADIAAELGYGLDTIKFIQLFSHDGNAEFESLDDFYVRATELAILIDEEGVNPKEELRNPQS